MLVLVVCRVDGEPPLERSLLITNSLGTTLTHNSPTGNQRSSGICQVLYWITHATHMTHIGPYDSPILFLDYNSSLFIMTHPFYLYHRRLLMHHSLIRYMFPFMVHVSPFSPVHPYSQSRGLIT